MSDELRELRLRLAELSDLRNAARLLGWDQQTMMPPRGAQERAETLATIERISHGMFVSDDTGHLLEAAQRSLDGAAPDSDEARLITVTKRRWEKARRVPSELAADLARAASVAQEAWAEARSKSDFGSFAPYLSRNLELARRYVDCFEEFDSSYDVLLDDYEPGMKSSEAARLFAQLRAELVPLIEKLREHAERVDDSPLHGEFPIDGQRALVKSVIAMMGYDEQSWRIDDAVHPFATSFGSADVRITSRWDPGYFASGMYGAMHECGHGLYEAGIAPELQRTPLGTGESLGLHESQSRMWENMVGRGRSFCGVLTALIEAHLPSAAPLDQDTLYKAVNKVKPSYIRVESDEATYGLHIVLRFELEQQLLEGAVSVAELPEAWNARFQDYLGLKVTDDADGVLQDVHWAAGLIGYFPTYALGNLIAGQLWRRARADLPQLEEQLGAGELGVLREWLREHVHRHGAKFSADELLERELGEPLAVGPFVDYLRRKLSEVYELKL